MPIRVALILFGLFAACVAVVLLAWSCGSEFYMLIPGSRVRSSLHPFHPVGMLGLLAFCSALYLYSQRYALLFFTALLGGLLLGTLVGWGVFNWQPTLSQGALIVAMITASSYGWTIRDDYLDD